VRGQGLCKLVVESVDMVESRNLGWDNELSIWCSEVMYIPPSQDSWYAYLYYFLHHGTCTEHLGRGQLLG